jgi:enoyl-CoA hydratase/carnithine racemase
MVVSLHAFLEQATTAPTAMELSAATGRPAVVVDLSGVMPPIDAAGVARVLRGLPTVLIGVADRALQGAAVQVAPLLDVVVRDPDRVLRGVEQFPLASVTLAQIFRATLHLDIDAALAAESAGYSLLQAGPEFARWRASRVMRDDNQSPGRVVDVVRDDSCLSITLSRPAKHNALNSAMRDQLCDALILGASDPTISTVINAGAGPSFCSGGDLDEFGTLTDPATAHLIRLTRSAGRLIALSAQKVEAHLHGACMGAGIELAAFASRVIADPGALIALPELELGLIPGAGGTVSLPRRIGRQRTCELALSQACLDAATALTWGLVDEISSFSK